MTTTLAAAPSAETAVGDLVLVRMTLPSKRPVTSSAVRRDVGKLLGPDFSATGFDDLRNELAAAGFLTKGKRNTFTLTDAGRERALRFLGVIELPPGVNWSTVVAKYLVPKAAGLSEDAVATLNNGDKLAAFVLKRKFGLDVAAGSTVNQALEAIACKRLGYSQETALDGLLCAVLSELIGSERLTKEELAKQLPLFETGLTTVSADEARCKVVRDWLGTETLPLQRQLPPESPPPEPFDLTAFASTVTALAAKSPPEARSDDNKVFIAALWRATQEEPSFPRLGLPEFKERVVEAHSRNLLRLSRSDMVSATDSQLVADSETEYLNAAFHFVVLEGEHA
jgi:hypothetical protein